MWRGLGEARLKATPALRQQDGLIHAGVLMIAKASSTLAVIIKMDESSSASSSRYVINFVNV